MSRMSDLDLQRQNLERFTGSYSMSEAELLALEQQHDSMIAAAKRVRYHLTECDHGDAETLAALDELLKHIGIHGDVVPQPLSQPAGEMACHEGD